MRFLHPGLLNWGWLLLVPIALYLFRPRPRKVRVSSLLFFKSLAREHQESAWLRRLKRLLSLLINALIISFVVLALAHPVVSPKAESLVNVVILIDRSASMAARDGQGRTRLDVGIAEMHQRLAGLPGGVGVMVMAYDLRAEILLPFTLDRRGVGRALDSMGVRPIEGDPDAALRLARRLASLQTPAAIWHVTDSPTTETEREPDGEVSIACINAGFRQPINAGITAFRLRRLPLAHARYEAFVQVHGTGPAPQDAELEVRLDGALTAIRSMTLKPGGRERLLIPVGAGQGNVLSMKISVKNDVLPLDDVVHARIPELRPANILWISGKPDPFTELALASLSEDMEVSVYQGDPSVWPHEQPVDVVIFDGWLPGEWPADLPVVVIDPPHSLGPVRAVRIQGDGLPVDALRVTDEHHPLLYGVASDRVSVVQTAVLEAEGPLEPLWVGPTGPVMVAGEVNGQRLVVMGFTPGKCERLPLMASCPLLLGNTIYWSSEPKADIRSGHNHRTGDQIALEGRTLTWHDPGSREEIAVEAAGRFTELDHLGLWRTEAGEAGSAALLSQRETLLPSSETADGETQKETYSASVFRGDLTLMFLTAVFVLLLLESWLFHKHVVY